MSVWKNVVVGLAAGSAFSLVAGLFALKEENSDSAGPLEDALSNDELADVSCDDDACECCDEDRLMGMGDR